VYDKHPDVTDESLGIRAMRVKRAKAVERAMQLTRHALGPSWAELTPDEVHELRWILGEMWSYLPHNEWDTLHFGYLTVRDVIVLLTLASQLRRHARGSVEILREAEKVVRAERGRPPLVS
jgi:hypothetical protein